MKLDDEKVDKLNFWAKNFKYMGLFVFLISSAIFLMIVLYNESVKDKEFSVLAESVKLTKPESVVLFKDLIPKINKDELERIKKFYQKKMIKELKKDEVETINYRIGFLEDRIKILENTIDRESSIRITIWGTFIVLCAGFVLFLIQFGVSMSNSRINLKLENNSEKKKGK